LKLTADVLPLQPINFFTPKQFKDMTKKKLYERPSMKVVLLKRQPQLLAGSGLNDPENYPGEGNPFTF
jgi:hypothetical protein